jgi:hypothetical protein
MATRGMALIVMALGSLTLLGVSAWLLYNDSPVGWIFGGVGLIGWLLYGLSIVLDARAARRV